MSNRVAMASKSIFTDGVKLPLKRHDEFFYCTKDDCYDDLIATATLFDFNGKYVYWCGIDLANSNRIFVDLIYKHLQTITNKLDRDNLYVNATHTHSGAEFRKFKTFHYETEDTVLVEVVEHFAKILGELFLECESKLEEYDAKIKVNHIEGCYSNRNALDKPCDKNFTLIKFTKHGTDELLGLWMNMACHSTIIFPKNPKMSSDLIGNIAAKLREHYGCNVMPTPGCQGDTSTRLTRERSQDPALDLSELHRLANEVYQQVISTDDFKDITIDRFETSDVKLSFEYVIKPEVIDQKCAELKAKIDSGMIEPRQRKIFNDAYKGLSSKRNMGKVYNTLIARAVNMGELKWALFPGELVASLGLQIVKHQDHDHVLVGCYINEGVGYLVEQEEYGNAFESLGSIIPVGLPEVLTSMTKQEIENFYY